MFLTAGIAALIGRGGGHADAACADVNVVVARGTGEPGALGVVVGDPVFAAMQQAVQNKALTATAVNYPASLALNSASTGNTNLVNMVMAAMQACPNQQFVLVGYSQGANVVDNSLGVSSAGALVGAPITAMLPAAALAQVDAVMLFGNPIRAQGKNINNANAAKTLDVCANGDPVCMAGGNNVAAHLSYTQNATMAAQFAATMIANAGKPAANAAPMNNLTVNNNVAAGVQAAATNLLQNLAANAMAMNAANANNGAANANNGAANANNGAGAANNGAANAGNAGAANAGQMNGNAANGNAANGNANQMNGNAGQQTGNGHW